MACTRELAQGASLRPVLMCVVIEGLYWLAQQGAGLCLPLLE